MIDFPLFISTATRGSNSLCRTEPGSGGFRESSVKNARWMLRASGGCARLRTIGSREHNGWTRICGQYRMGKLCAFGCSGLIIPPHSTLGDTKGPQGRDASRAQLYACAPFRIFFHCPRRSQNPHPPRITCCRPTSTATPPDLRITVDPKVLTSSRPRRSS